MRLLSNTFAAAENRVLHYYEVKNNRPPLLLLHAQGTDAMSYKKCLGALSKYFHIYLVDCYGHGKSSRCADGYTLSCIGEDVVRFIERVIGEKTVICGHSSGGLIACYSAAHSDLCCGLLLEDPPLFSCVGDRRLNTYNYVDLSTVCHNYLAEEEKTDFPLYYFMHQYAWNFFPQESREKIRTQMVGLARQNREKHPERDLRVPFWPKAFLEGFKGMQNYDPYFGEAFYSNAFHTGVDYEQLLRDIRCKTLFMKANTTVGADGLVQGALTEEDLENVCRLIPEIRVERFDCGHSIHSEKRKAFITCVTDFVR